MMLSKSEPLPEGTVIMADNQYAGRGQQQNVWYAEPGLNLTISVLLKPVFLPVSQQFMLNIAVSNGISKALQQLVKADLRVKWPNDIYYKDQKIGGVLIENSVFGSVIKSSVIGIGLNVNQKSFDPQISTVATSLSKILQEDVNLSQLLGEICSHLEAQYLKLKSNNSINLHRDYLANLYQFDQPGLYRHNGEIFEGKITDVTRQGSLVVSANGRLREYNFKEIEFVRAPKTGDA